MKQQIPEIIALKPTLVEPILYQMFQIQSLLYSSIQHALPQSLVNQSLDVLYNDINNADLKIRELETIAGTAASSNKLSLNRKNSKDNNSSISSKPPMETAISQDSIPHDPPYKIRPSGGFANTAPPPATINPFNEAPPQYSSNANISAPVAVASNPWATQQPVIPPKPKTGLGTATAIYDFPGQEQGDLPFRQGDVITILEKTNTTEDWWKGKLGLKTGMFPANYVKMN